MRVLSVLAVNNHVARAIIRKLHVALWPKRLDTPGIEGSFCNELSIVLQETANGKRDRILTSMNTGNSVLSAAHEPISLLDISNVERPNISNKSVNGPVVQKGDKLFTIDNPVIKDEIKTSATASYNLPVIKIDVFSGNVTEFPVWEIAFNALIDQQVNSVELKLNLLSQHLTLGLPWGPMDPKTIFNLMDLLHLLSAGYGTP